MISSETGENCFDVRVVHNSSTARTWHLLQFQNCSLLRSCLALHWVSCKIMSRVVGWKLKNQPMNTACLQFFSEIYLIMFSSWYAWFVYHYSVTFTLRKAFFSTLWWQIAILSLMMTLSLKLSTYKSVMSTTLVYQIYIYILVK